MKINLYRVLVPLTLCFFGVFVHQTRAAEMPTNDIAIFQINDNAQLTEKLFHLTYRDGYDNQPKFSVDGSKIYFTRSIGQQTDLMQYSFVDKSLRNITMSDNLSEYSPTPFRKGYLSAIGMTKSGKQYLNQISLDSAASSPFTTAIEPIGYHAWLNREEAAVFVLGETMTLQVLHTAANRKPTVLAKNIGRCLQKYGDEKVSFTQLVDGHHQIKFIDQNHHISDAGISLPAEVEDYVWWNDNSVIYADGSQLFLSDGKQQRMIADLSIFDIMQMSRLALDKVNHKIAVVYER